jgi:hypothetical protein
MYARLKMSFKYAKPNEHNSKFGIIIYMNSKNIVGEKRNSSYLL